MNYATKEDLEALEKRLKEFLLVEKGFTITGKPEPQTPLFEPKKEVWELYPDYKSCVDYGDFFYYHKLDGQLEIDNIDKCNLFATHTKKLAKRQLAELQLAKIADKWGDGIEIENDNIYFPVLLKTIDFETYIFDKGDATCIILPFYFKTRKQCQKSIELHSQLWKDWFMVG